MPLVILRKAIVDSLSHPRMHHSSFPLGIFAYYLSLSHGYAHLLLIVCNLLDLLRVYPFTHLHWPLKGTLCHGVYNAFFLPFLRSPSLLTTHLQCILTHMWTHTFTHHVHISCRFCCVCIPRTSVKLVCSRCLISSKIFAF